MVIEVGDSLIFKKEYRHKIGNIYYIIKHGSIYKAVTRAFNKGYGTEVSIVYDDRYVIDIPIVEIETIKEYRDRRILSILD